MVNLDIARRRLRQQCIARPLFEKPVDVVRWFGAVQAQDYAGALWALGLRMRAATAADVEQAIADKSVVRTWFMRGTLHFVPGEDLRWMLQLMAPRMRRLLDSAISYNKLELDETTIGRSNAVIASALQGGKQLTREELAEALAGAGIASEGLRRSFLIQHAQVDSLICYATRRGKQATFALIDEWVPPAPLLERDEALATFARRYFTGHGPATLQDFTFWSGLTVTEARTGLEMIQSELLHETINGQVYWFAPSTPPASESEPGAHLLPNYDEYMVGYTDRGAIFDEANVGKLHAHARGGILTNTIVVDGQVFGTWTHITRKNTIVIEPHLLHSLSEEESRAVTLAAGRYGAFLACSVTIPSQMG
ncbi:MAG TPA: winged helix DNA-binding domain-containing protein [Ktedonobacteraceae bacterium]